MAPGGDIGVHGTESGAVVGLRRNRGVVDQRMQFTVFQPLPYFRNRARGVVVVGEVDLDVILGACAPRALFGEGMPRAGDDTPTGAGKPDRGGMADSAAGSSQKQRATRRVGRTRHVDLSGFDVRDRAAPWTTAGPVARGGIRCGRAGGTDGRARIRTERA